jgi:hypothetical protein
MQYSRIEKDVVAMQTLCAVSSAVAERLFTVLLLNSLQVPAVVPGGGS